MAEFLLIIYIVCVCDIGRFARRQVHEFKHCIQTQTISLYFKTILLQKMILLKTFFLNKILLPKKNFWIWKNFELTNFSYRNVASKKNKQNDTLLFTMITWYFSTSFQNLKISRNGDIFITRSNCSSYDNISKILKEKH